VIGLCVATTFVTACTAVGIANAIWGNSEPTAGPPDSSLCIFIAGMIVGAAIGIAASRELFREQ